MHSLLGQDPSLSQYITAPLEEVHNLAFAVIAHDLFSLLPRDSEYAVRLVRLGSRVKCIIYRVMEGCLSTMLSFLSEESRNVSLRRLGGRFEFGLGMLETGCTRSVIRKFVLASGLLEMSPGALANL